MRCQTTQSLDSPRLHTTECNTSLLYYPYKRAAPAIAPPPCDVMKSRALIGDILRVTNNANDITGFKWAPGNKTRARKTHFSLCRTVNESK